MGVVPAPELLRRVAVLVRRGGAWHRERCHLALRRGNRGASCDDRLLPVRSPGRFLRGTVSSAETDGRLGACRLASVPLMEARSLERRKGYAELQRRVPSALLPWPPALGQRVKAKRT